MTDQYKKSDCVLYSMFIYSLRYLTERLLVSKSVKGLFNVGVPHVGGTRLQNNPIILFFLLFNFSVNCLKARITKIIYTLLSTFNNLLDFIEFHFGVINKSIFDF